MVKLQNDYFSTTINTAVDSNITPEVGQTPAVAANTVSVLSKTFSEISYMLKSESL